MAANMYRVGDYVYFETSSTTPYQIRRIEELNKTLNGNVEAKVMCFYRRRDISSSLILLADKHQSVFGEEEDYEDEEEDDVSKDGSEKSMDKKVNGEVNGNATNGEKKKGELSDTEKHQLKHRELFLSRQVETLPATHIRGKCSVTLLNETESLLSYAQKDDHFFYSLVYDPAQKTLLADKGEIRVGSRFQADVTPLLGQEESDGRDLSTLEELVWNPLNPLSDRQTDQFMVIARSVGTFARALDCTSTVRQPSLHMSAAAASRDVTLLHAMNTLHSHEYELAAAMASLVPSGGPVLCRDEMEEWSASEANLFEEALEKYGKDFKDIRTDFLPWKSLKAVVEYYYMWKTTDRYVQQKRIKAAEAESKLKQVYIPNYNKPNPAQLSEKDNTAQARPCESCYVESSSQWFAWGPVHMNCRLCSACWTYWKKCGGLKMPTRIEGERPPPHQRQERMAHMSMGRLHKCTISGCGKEFRVRVHLARHLATAHGLTISSQPGGGGGSPRPAMKTRAAFCLITTVLTRISRQVCSDVLKIRRAARMPFLPINIASIKQECQSRLPAAASRLRSLRPRAPKYMRDVCARLGVDVAQERPALLEPSKPRPEPKRLAFPYVPPSERPAIRQNDAVTKTSIMGKRSYDQTNGIDGPAAKRAPMGVIREAGAQRQVIRGHQQGGRNTVISSMNGGRIGLKPMLRQQSVPVRGRSLLSWVDAPDDVFFIATDATKKLRKQMKAGEFRRAGRVPWRRLNVRYPYSEGVSQGQNGDVVVLD